ncbi:MAG TPA: T9SS type A sorting domain-containing protein [Flavobacterium sp.]|jgi:pimeloyl-ACP methyl ester carboxylesterase|uniref:T9SS type A sorting domain-containing protein n=1 Tax=Flavobacterium sp. TaxID=239 RepID=UPI002C49DC93|nr:T9SS type A sorting domain-containing protein [Flavobacterium sp.]HPW97959.1 T9SS type A sorting domain-containing protein [Flavobacterium sp.]HQA74109.1 T9SS type A sorting domain-containing protein [Flavobacterium sp.]
MKLKITLLALLSGFISTFAQDKMFDLLKDKTETNILYNRVFALSHANEMKTKEISTTYFLQVYHEIQRADFNNRLPKLEVIRKAATLASIKNQIPLSVLISDFESISENDLQNKFNLNASNQLELKNNETLELEKHAINIVAPIVAKSKTNEVTFVLNSDLIFNTTSREIKSIFYSKENSSWQKINQNQPFTVHFAANGTQELALKIEFTNGTSTEESISFEVNSTILIHRNSNSVMAASSITATIPYQGFGETAAVLGQGEFEIFLDNVDGVLDKPIILVDGFDPGDTRNTTTIYDLLNYGTNQNFADDLRNQGFDIVVLNFPTYTIPGTTTVIDGGADYIQRNAYILVELLNQINAQKVGAEKNVVIGPSMGGLISRYALRYMEMNNLVHDTRLYLSFDSPHQGANVPIGFQHLFNYMAYGPLGNAAVQPIVDGLIKSPAARQMLIDHMEGHLQSGSAFEFNTAAASLLPTGAPNFRTAFQDELNTMGFPTLTRNVSIANGAGNGTMNYTPDFEVMNHTFNITTSQRAIINLRFTPAANQTNQVSRFRGQQYVVILWITGFESLANSKAPTFTAGLDSAPGGRFDMTGFAGGLGTDPILTEFFDNLNADYFTFIPTWSSMAISGTNNLYTPVTASTVSPFVASSIPTINENHITFNAQNVAFALNEILNPPLSTSNPELESIWVKNPVENVIEINANYSLENASILLTDMLGKNIYQSNNQTIHGSLSIPIDVSKGIYLLTIDNGKQRVTKKLVKN